MLPTVDAAVLTIQRTFRRKVSAKRLQRRRSCESYLATIEPMVCHIQRIFRGWQGRLDFLFHWQVRAFHAQRWQAAMLVQREWRRLAALRRAQLEELVQEMTAIRQEAAVEVQRVWRSHSARRAVHEELTHAVLKWQWDGPRQEVNVKGDFTVPPWGPSLKMRFCTARKQYVHPIARLDSFRRMRVAFKFQVNGRWICDGSLPIASDRAGNCNNYLDIEGDAAAPLAREVSVGARMSAASSAGSRLERSQGARCGAGPSSPPRESRELSSAGHALHGVYSREITWPSNSTPVQALHTVQPTTLQDRDEGAVLPPPRAGASAAVKPLGSLRSSSRQPCREAEYPLSAKLGEAQLIAHSLAEPRRPASSSGSSSVSERRLAQQSASTNGSRGSTPSEKAAPGVLESIAAVGSGSLEEL